MIRWLHTICLAGALSLGACTTPSVPIPPPEPESVFFELDLELGEASFRYDAEPSFAGATVYVFNRDVGEGIITTAEGDGSVGPTQPIPAQVGDEVVITFETGTQLTSTCLLMRDGRSDSSQRCPL